jgi:hypothetical protein
VISSPEPVARSRSVSVIEASKLDLVVRSALEIHDDRGTLAPSASVDPVKLA